MLIIVIHCKLFNSNSQHIKENEMYTIEDDRERQLFDDEQMTYENEHFRGNIAYMSEINQRKLSITSGEFQEELKGLMMKYVSPLADIHIGYKPVSSKEFHRLCGEFFIQSCTETLDSLFKEKK